MIVSVILALENGGHSDWGYKGILSSKQKLICWSWAKLKVWWRACQRLFNAWVPIEFDGFCGWWLAFLDTVHKVPQPLVLQHNFLIFSSKNDLLVFLAIFSSQILTWICNICYDRHLLDAAWIWAKGNDDMIGCAACSSVSTSCSRYTILASSSCSMTCSPYVLQTLVSWTSYIYSIDTTL